MIVPTFSVRMIWPFTRVLKNYSVEFETLREAGIEASVLANPDARVPHELAWKLLKVSIERTGNPALGLHAGIENEAADWGMLALAALSCSNVRQAILYCSKYIKLLDDFMDIELVEQRDKAIVQLRYKVANPIPALNDLLLSMAVVAINRFLGSDNEAPLELHAIHSEPAYANEYKQLFKAPVRFNAEHNAIIIAPHLLDRSSVRANPDLFLVFDKEVKRQFEDHVGSQSMSLEVQRLLIRNLGHKEVSINEVAKQVHMSPATLKRRLSQEETTFSKILDEVRREYALRYLEDQKLSIAEVALRLGFSSASTFGKAFRRWTGTSPVAYRSRMDLSNKE